MITRGRWALSRVHDQLPDGLLLVVEHADWSLFALDCRRGQSARRCCRVGPRWRLRWRCAHPVRSTTARVGEDCGTAVFVVIRQVRKDEVSVDLSGSVVVVDVVESAGEMRSFSRLCLLLSTYACGQRDVLRESRDRP